MYCVVKTRQPKGLSSLLMFLWHEVPWAVVKSQEFNSRAANLGTFSGQYVNCGNYEQLKGIWFLKDQMSQLRGFHLPLWPYFIQALVWNWGNGNWAQVPSCLCLEILRQHKEAQGPEVYDWGSSCVETHSYCKAAPLPLVELGNPFWQKHRAVWLHFPLLFSLYYVLSCAWCSVSATLKKFFRNW